MHNRSRFSLLRLAGLVSLSALAACQSTSPGRDAASIPLIVNDESALSGRLAERSEPVPIEPPAGAAPKRAAAFALTLIAELRPPVVGGRTLQATSVMLHGGFAYVSYNLKGDDRMGAVDVVQIENGSKATLRSQAVYPDREVHALHFDKNTLYLAQAGDIPGAASPAAWATLVANGGKLDAAGSAVSALGSYAATSVTVHDGTVLVTTGSNGGLYALGQSDGKVEAYRELSDARWVDADAARIVVAQGTPGRLAVLDRATLAPVKSIAFSGAGIPESKTTVRLLGDRALVAAGLGGAQLIDLATGSVLGSVPRPAVTGLDSALCVANSADADGDMAYVSFGEAGVYVATAGTDLSGGRKDGTPGSVPLTVLGKLKFADLQSANHVAYDGTLLAVAAGTGGVKIVRVSR